MWRPLLSPFFIGCVVAFVGHQILEFFGASTTLLRSYWDDLFALPIMLTLALVTLRWLYQRPQLQLPLSFVIGGSIWLAILFEELVPLYFTTATRDWFDYLAYLIGMFLFTYVGRSNGWVRKSESA